MKKFLSEFKDFAMRGNVIDLAVGVIIGGAFNAIVNSLVKDIITPLLSLVLGRINIAELKVVIPGMLNSGNIILSVGSFLQAIINFIIIALSVFFMVKAINKVHSRFWKEEKEVQEPEPAIPTNTEVLLTEIRDLLKEERK